MGRSRCVVVVRRPRLSGLRSTAATAHPPHPPPPDRARRYDPVLALAYAGAAVFLTLAAVMLFSNLRFPPHRFMHVLVFAALGGARPAPSTHER